MFAVAAVALFASCWAIFNVPVPGLSYITFQDVFKAYFAVSIIRLCFHMMLFGSASSDSYRVGRPKRSQKGGSGNG